MRESSSGIGSSRFSAATAGRYILGVNLTRTRGGHRLDDGAAVLLRDGAVAVAVAEERITRRKNASGVAEAVRYCLAAEGIRLGDLECIAVSNCCDTVPSETEAAQLLAEEGLDVSPGNICTVPSHHLSHASSAFYPSGFQSAVVIVADNEGNIVGVRQHPDYWRNSLERTSVFAGVDKEINLLERHGDAPGELSLGAAYSYFTNWLGFNSYHDAGKVMALAAYGSGRFRGVEVFDITSDHLRSRLGMIAGERSTDGFEPEEPSAFDKEAARFLQGESVRDFFLDQAGIDIGPARSTCHRPDNMQKEVAWLIQSELERALTWLVRRSIEHTGIRNVCLAGGVALNCVANTLLAEMPEVDGLFVQPAASDVGQSLGNALWAYRTRGLDKPWTMTSCSLGRSYSEQEVQAAIGRWDSQVDSTRPADPGRTCAQMLSGGAIVGWFSGGSEFGLRGLGRRSVLGDPRTHATKLRLDAEVKRREEFRPYAPSVLAEAVADWFEVGPLAEVASQPLSVMTVAPRVRKHRQALIPAVTFVDGSSRLHSVSQAENPSYHAMIKEFAQLTGVPLVLNTSFNLGGDPVVETPDEAIESMLKMNLDALFIEDFVVTARC